MAWQVRGYPCDCQWPEHCDSQQSRLPPTRMAQKAHQPLPAPPSSPPHLHQPTCNSSLHPDQASTSNEQSTGHSAITSRSLESDTNTLSVNSVTLPSPFSAAMPGDSGTEAGGPSMQAQASCGTDSQKEVGLRRGQHEGPDAAEADLERLEQEFVHDVYNAIAPHFSATRFAIWPKVLHGTAAPLCSIWPCSHCSSICW